MEPHVPPTTARTAWTATHRLVASFGFPKAVHCWRVMLTPDGSAYTRADWMQNLPPSFRPMAADAWAYHNPELNRSTIIKATLKPLTAENSPWRLDAAATPSTPSTPATPVAPLRNVI
jgi:hypothetical protein